MYTSRTGAGMALVMLAACGGGSSKPTDAPPAIDAAPDPTDGAVSGSRIKIRWQVFPDGSKEWFSLHDTQLDTDCYPYAFYGDPKLYCVPNAAEAKYSDATCQSPIALVGAMTCATDTPPKFIIQYADPTCYYGVAHIFRVGAQTSLTNFYQYASGGSCVGPSAVTNQTTYAPGTEVSKTDLVELTLSAPTSDALGVRYLESADGLRMPYAFHDSAGNFDCTGNAQYRGSPTASCDPSGQNANFFGDSSCGQAEMISFCNAPAYAFISPKSGCPMDSPTWAAVNPTAVSTTTVYNWNAQTQTCTMGSPPGTFAYQLGAPITVQPLMRVADTLPNRRLQTIHFVSGTQRMPDPRYMYDTMLGTECFVEQLADGSVICLPNAHLMGASAVYYSDAACTTPVNVAPVYSSGPATCAQPPLFKYVNKFTSGTCAPTFELHALGAQYTGTIYTKSGATCSASASSNVTYYQLGATLPSAGMASGTLQIDP